MRGELLADGCGAVGLLLDDAGRLAAQIAQVIQLGAAYLAAAHHGNRLDHRRHHREYPFHAFAIGNLAHREILVEPAAGAADADASIGLRARWVAFDHLDVDDHGVAGSEFRNGFAGGQFFELLFFELLNEVHRKFSIGGAPQPERARAARVFVYPVARTHRSINASIFWRQTGRPLARKTLGARIWRSYTAKALACHPSVAPFGRFCPLAWRASRSSCCALVRASASARAQAAPRGGAAERRISGIG